MTRYPPEALRALLARHMLFRDAPPTLVDGLVKFATVRYFEPSDEIFRLSTTCWSVTGCIRRFAETESMHSAARPDQ